MKKTLFYKGDTIIEVLLSIAILSVILVGAYVSVNNSTLTLRDSQEHAEALNIAQSQTESLIAWYASNSSKSYLTYACPEAVLHIVCGSAQISPSFNSSFCFNNTATPTLNGNCSILSGAINSGVQPSYKCNYSGHYCYTVTITSQVAYLPSMSFPGGGFCTINSYNYNIAVTWPSILVGNYNKSLSGSYSRVTLTYRPEVLKPSC